eukprot:5980777-Amphidinium_carterae.1
MLYGAHIKWGYALLGLAESTFRDLSSEEEFVRDGLGELEVVAAFADDVGTTVGDVLQQMNAVLRCFDVLARAGGLLLNFHK